MSRLAITMAITGALVAGACGGKKTEEPPATASGSAPATGSAPDKPGSGSAPATGSATAAGSGSGSGSASAPVAAKDPELPTAEDFEEDATSRITEKNLETEVKALEKELGEN